MYKPLSRKQQLEILKSQDEFHNRLRTHTWSNPTSDTEFRLAALTHFSPARNDRQIFNLAKLGSY